MKYSFISDTGLIREKNQDSLLTVENSYGDCLLIVADGIGGGKAGEVASYETTKYFDYVFKQSGPFETVHDAIEYLKLHLGRCNRNVYDLSCKYEQYSGMGTTITGVLVTKNYAITLNCGDSRVYGYIDNKMFHLTDDDTLVNQMLKSGKISYEEAINHPKRHYLVKAIGIFSNVVCDVHQVKMMDYFLICSDGLHGYVSEEEISQVVLSEITLDEKVNKLKDIALSKGGFDNVTIILGESDHE